MATPEDPVSGTLPARDDSPTPSDKDTDTFEDAVDTGSVRSLTNRKASQTRVTQPSSPDAETIPDLPETPAEAFKTIEPTAEGDAETFDYTNDTLTDTTNSARSSKRISSTTLDNVDLDENIPSEQPKRSPLPDIVARSREASAERSAVTAEQPVPGVVKQPTKKLSLSNITASLPSMPWSPNPDSPPKTSPNVPTSSNAPLPPPPPPTRKITSPFAWLSRNSTQKEVNVMSPPATTAGTPRRNTASSVTTLTSNPEMMLSKLEEEGEMDGPNGKSRPQRNSLRDRFKMVRLREEAGISLDPSDEDKAHGAVANLIVRSATMSPGTENAPDIQGPTSPLPSSADTKLAPGTVSGVSAGPSAIADVPVDWDLWQSVVYEGPTAVARTSPEELNRAITTGIPNAIRGVVWQVLAQSKDDELEMTYRELVARGTDKEFRKSNSTAASNVSAEKDIVVSSASSIASERSGGVGKKLPSPPPESEAAIQAQTLSAAEKQKALQKLEKVIRRDLGARTSYSKHAAAAGLQEGLFGVCKAYALYDAEVGYAQGMNFLIMPLLFNMPEEEAFCLLVRLMKEYKLRDLFIQDMPGLHMHLHQFERLLEDFEPALYCHLHRRGISPHLYATQWFLTLFAYRFPLQLVLRIYDLILSEGLSAILRFGIVLMQKNAFTLLGMSDMSQLTVFLKDKIFDVYIDQSPSAGSILENGFFGSSSANVDKEIYRADQLVRDACEIKFSPALLKTYAAEWEEKTRVEKEREKEVVQLRTANAKYAVRVRDLEDRIAATDREQADVMNQLVRHQVENEELKDKNESLSGQVKELRNVIEKQPAEIEEQWRQERDKLIERNAEVHDLNLRLQNEKEDLEEQLVQTKMKHAEVNSEHETLKQKWQELKRQFA
ncbi:RabGAP/TBC [Xylariaceae sp. FL1019]|nr:RabGAP/TBC [Xylariaceae sp. FL1019]